MTVYPRTPRPTEQGVARPLGFLRAASGPRLHGVPADGFGDGVAVPVDRTLHLPLLQKAREVDVLVTEFLRRLSGGDVAVQRRGPNVVRTRALCSATSLQPQSQRMGSGFSSQKTMKSMSVMPWSMVLLVASSSAAKPSPFALIATFSISVLRLFVDLINASILAWLSRVKECRKLFCEVLS
jgi:hypothetical protein